VQDQFANLFGKHTLRFHTWIIFSRSWCNLKLFIAWFWCACEAKNQI